ncbi:vacuolar protein sorting-associated protein 37B [Sitophilus oryzae]|uniref:Vacuolar protein sorting-associated protein 37B n=1 Tax=Sitophilus oryzae TaxID=7048 RepID=A0A6J2XJS1_SITOR|nr:vacuolar protein sorting-associated protein 37B [Sitophilus oryzae]
MSIAVLQFDAKRAVEQLEDLSNDDLDQIINNDEKFEEILLSLDQSYVKELEVEKENLIAQNKSMAEFNLSKEPELVEGREKLKNLYDDIEKITNIIEEKSQELKQKGGDISLETALALLQTAASEMEEESDSCAQKFLNGEIEIDEFLEQFAVKRKLMHTRLVKADKLSKILQLGDLSLLPSYINAPPVNINPGYFPGIPTSSPSSVPYPTGPLNMPMPSEINYFQNF